MKVYMVTDGNYSDYRVLCVCSTKDKAEYAKKFYKAENDINAIELDELPPHPEGTFRYCVTMDSEGMAWEIDTVSPDNYHFESMMGCDWYPDDNTKGTVAFFMWAKDEKHAVKIANEKRAMLIASGLWTTDYHEWHAKRGILKAWASGQAGPMTEVEDKP